MGLLEKRVTSNGRRTTEYVLTAAGEELQSVIDVLMTWGATWAFGGPRAEELDPVLLMWWMRDRICAQRLPEKPFVIQFDFHFRRHETYWLLIEEDAASVCISDPGYEINVAVTTDLSVFYELWLGRISYHEAVSDYGVKIDAIPAYIRAFPRWFSWSPAAPIVRASMRKQQAQQ
jgi:hypothetical protein